MSRLWVTDGKWKVEQYSVWAESAISVSVSDDKVQIFLLILRRGALFISGQRCQMTKWNTQTLGPREPPNCLFLWGPHVNLLNDEDDKWSIFNPLLLAQWPKCQRSSGQLASFCLCLPSFISVHLDSYKLIIVCLSICLFAFVLFCPLVQL